MEKNKNKPYLMINCNNKCNYIVEVNKKDVVIENKVYLEKIAIKNSSKSPAILENITIDEVVLLEIC